MENLPPQFVGSIIDYVLALMILKYPNGQLPVAIDQNQLQTMASETVVYRFPCVDLYRAVPLTATCTVQTRATNQECSKRDAIPRSSNN